MVVACSFQSTPTVLGGYGAGVRSSIQCYLLSAGQLARRAGRFGATQFTPSDTMQLDSRELHRVGVGRCEQDMIIFNVFRLPRTVADSVHTEHCTRLSAPAGVCSIVMSVSVCLFMCESVRSNISQKPHVQTSSNFLCLSPMFVVLARFFSNGLWMTPFSYNWPYDGLTEWQRSLAAMCVRFNTPAAWLCFVPDDVGRHVDRRGLRARGARDAYALCHYLARIANC